MNTNLGKTKEEIIYELLLSINRGNTGYCADRVDLAITQYNYLVQKNIIIEKASN